MKKTFMLFSILLIGAFVLFGFQASDIQSIQSDNSIEIEKQQVISNSEIYHISAISNGMYKCGEGKCGEGKAEKKSEKTQKVIKDQLKKSSCSGKKKANCKKEEKCGGKCGEGKCGAAMKGKAPKSKLMEKDTDKDGKISKAEFTANRDEGFAKKDKNSDGKLTKDECPMFTMFETSSDDFMTKEEFYAGNEKMFSMMDKNADGFISGDEAKAMHAKMSGKKCGEGKCGEGKCGEGKASNTVNESELKHECSGKKKASCCRSKKSSCKK